MNINTYDNTINIAEYGGIWLNARNIAERCNTTPEKIMRWATSSEGICAYRENITDAVANAAEAAIAGIYSAYSCHSEKTFDLVLKEVPDDQGLTGIDIADLFKLLADDQAYPIEIQATHVQSCAMGLISRKAAIRTGFDIECLSRTVASVLDDVALETPDGVYAMCGLTAKIVR